MLFCVIIMALVVAADQISKLLVLEYLAPIGQVKLIDGVFHLTYVENRGAAFGSLTDARWVFMIFSVIAIVGVTAYLLCFAENKRMLRWALALVIGGGIGNMIDRVALGYVVDFIDFCGIWSYIFNVADSCVCIGMGLLVLYVILSMREEMKEHKQARTEKADDEPNDGGKA